MGMYRGYHDLGGDREVAPRLTIATSPPPGWAKLVEAIRNTLGDTYCLHEQRRKVEELGPEVFDRAGYYGIRALAMREVLAEKGVLSLAQLEDRIEKIRREGVRDAGQV